MRRKFFTPFLGLIILFGGATAARSEVRRVEMHIAGYLCGN
jgi:hypothetical protein